MKKIVLFILMALPAAACLAQKGTISSTPKKVQAGFTRDHPGEANARWAKSKGQWRANYTSSGRSVDEYYNRKGERSFRRTEWDRKNMPAVYNQKIMKQYNAGDYRVSKIERPKNPVLYEVKYTKDGNDKTVYTDENGNEVKYHTKY